MIFQHSKELRSLKWGVGTLNFVDSWAMTLEKKIPHSKSTITLREPYYISPSKKRDYRVHFSQKDSISIYRYILDQICKICRYLLPFYIFPHTIFNSFPHTIFPIFPTPFSKFPHTIFHFFPTSFKNPTPFFLLPRTV